ncbi:hypothetical protein BU24DRAFT_489824 [Aaosphaeria arxii CBS 175.79]|uniref:Xylanolytic transcriptional activator regulatory domain-containing protein n=1 Tax=Aaosphaeria arxii CBS 175.79 TaxID=1450172 RepID=A0A6A5Y3Z2_9PLEO|nr:uncharacterized protein BU24DRAFT_489824 [Aaosphaeria arxii CBS 175.79]KAF2019976.1 hypothetical protein BU24DRAFT_489824 [Aaosphaeria arxii CBS 175.79]
MLAPSILNPISKIDVQQCMKFTFLLNFTTTTGLVGSFECGTPEWRSIAAQQSATSSGETGSESFQRPQYELSAKIMDLFEGADILTYGPSPDFVSEYFGQGGESDLTRRIVHNIRDATIVTRRKDDKQPLWSDSLEAMSYDFFSLAKLHKFLGLFWSCWYPNWPAIHKPSFRLSEASITLVISMTVLGACLSPDERERAKATLWFSATEELVFSSDIWSQDLAQAWQNSDHTAQRQSQLEIIQAAYCVTLIHTWEGCKEHVLRVRRQRYNAIISMLRDIGLNQATLRDVDTSNVTKFDWTEFIQRESLVRICTYVFNLDGGFALFYYHPTRMLLREMVIDLATPEACFQAGSAEECFVELRSWRHSLYPSRILTLVDVVRSICSEETSREIEHLLARASTLNMFTIIIALYSLVSQVESSLVVTVDDSSLRNGLERWNTFWPSSARQEEIEKGNMDYDSSWRRIGFMRHAPEFWLISQLKLDRLSKQRKEGLVADLLDTQYDTTTMGGLESLIREFQASKISVT